MMHPALIPALVFLSAACAVLGVASLVFDLFIRHRVQVNERLRAEFHGEAPQASTEPTALFKDLKQLAANAPKRPGPWMQFSRAVEQSGMGISAQRLVHVTIFLGWTMGLLAWLLARQVWVGSIGFCLGMTLPLLLIPLRRNRRIALLRSQLPDAFDLMARAIQATRTGVLELKMFAVTLTVQRQSGGNPVEMLQNLATVIRKRTKLIDRVKALTGEGRMQATVLLFMPFVMFAAMYLLNRSYAEVLFRYPSIVLSVLAVEFVGALWIRKLIHFEY